MYFSLLSVHFIKNVLHFSTVFKGNVQESNLENYTNIYSQIIDLKETERFILMHEKFFIIRYLNWIEFLFLKEVDFLYLITKYTLLSSYNTIFFYKIRLEVNIL